MRHFRAISFKFISTLALMYIVLGVALGLAFPLVLLFTMTLIAVEYIIGDLVILRRTNNTVATIADFGMALVLIWLMTANLEAFRNPFYAALVASLALAMFEYFFHRYVANHILSPDLSSRSHPTTQFQTEASNEFHLNTTDDRYTKDHEKKKKPTI
ncbi:DUF2512 family protein [Bacillus sp. V5-8f]|uniref:DUF2512 family protein n=1 Tax=Bacillus sp. V5-8f TaxID=2053044 RepID=UPI000C77F69F|nr:DUF2512 family protein [Bacillus sp. V5-8f]PLT32114.1 hypothetical protein CUU64_21360 [Bacillus sp. V5-8f]